MDNPSKLLKPKSIRQKKAGDNQAQKKALANGAQVCNKKSTNKTEEFMTAKKRTMRELNAFMRERAMKINLWRNASGLTRQALAEKLGCTAEMIRLYESPTAPAWIPAHRLRKLREAGCPSAILMPEGKFLHELELEGLKS